MKRAHRIFKTKMIAIHSDFLAVTSEDHAQLLSELTAMGSVVPPSFAFPSRYMLSRFLEGYFRGSHAHMPFLHAISFSTSKAGVELVLSLAAAGAFYRFEHARGYKLYHAAKTLINWQLARLYETTFSRLASTNPGYAGFTSFRPGYVASQGRRGLQLLQGLLILMDITSWSDRALIQDALSTSSQAAMLARQFSISVAESSFPPECSWEEWIEREERRRTLFAAYTLFNLQCIAFNVPPLILNSDISLNLPAAASEWKLPNSEAWSIHQNAKIPRQRPFSAVFAQLLAGNPIHHESNISSFGNYVLIHGLFQQIFFSRIAASCLTNSTDLLPTDFVKKMESALRNWQESSEATRDTPLLRLVYIRLNANTDPNRDLLTRDPMGIAHAFGNSRAVFCERSAHLDRAILQCIHALSVPIRVGIAFVARTQTLNWSVQHSLCNLECAILLVNWLLALATDVEALGNDALRPDEHKLVDILTSLVRETELAELIDNTCNYATRLRRLATPTTRLWAETFRGFQGFELVYTIGAGLSIIAESLEKDISNVSERNNR
ncbi:hypothetical protein GQ53DRAFT_792190 [Thozetella sp. PMI_491]|nr:hypothetical protein GQ53DRAFT_792190 [Thozetella sp. PMI_491]